MNLFKDNLDTSEIDDVKKMKAHQDFAYELIDQLKQVYIVYIEEKRDMHGIYLYVNKHRYSVYNGAVLHATSKGVGLSIPISELRIELFEYKRQSEKELNEIFKDTGYSVEVSMSNSCGDTLHFNTLLSRDDKDLSKKITFANKLFKMKQILLKLDINDIR